jgi:hypothetical protein
MLTKSDLLQLNGRVLNGTGKWKEPKGEKDVEYVLDVIDDSDLAWPVRAAKAALAIVTLQVFDDTQSPHCVDGAVLPDDLRTDDAPPQPAAHLRQDGVTAGEVLRRSSQP